MQTARPTFGGQELGDNRWSSDYALLLMRQSLKRVYHRCKPHFRWLWQWILFYRRILRALPVAKIPVSSKFFGRPKGYYRTTQEYQASTRASRMGNVSREIYPAETVRFTLPTPLEGGEAHWKFKENQVKEIPPARVFELHNARFWGHYGGSIITEDDRLLADLSPDVLGLEHHRIFAAVKLPRCRRLDGTVAVLSTAEAGHNYWHWTFDLLPRLHLLQQAGFTPANVNFYLVNHSGLHFQEQTLSEAGIPSEKIIWTNARTHIEAERMIVSSLKPAQLHVSNWTCRFLHGLAPEGIATNKRRLFVGRGAAAFRQWRNEDEVFHFLKGRGFERIACDKLSVAEQRRVFSEAEIVIAAHGAAMANIIYCRPETTFVEVFPSNYVDASMWPAASYLRLKHYYVLGEGATHDANARKQDLFLAAQKFPLLFASES
jgi:capsular polysaccharide biosynthesis protein